MQVSELRSLLEQQSSATPTGRIVRVLSERGSLSAVQIARISGLAKSTVSMTLAELRKSGLVIESEGAPQDRGVGRPAIALTLNPEAGTCIGVHLGLGDVTVMVADVSHAVINETRIPMTADYTPAQAFGAFCDTLSDIYRANKLSRRAILGLGISASGPVNPQTGVIMRSSILPFWAGTNLRQIFAGTADYPVLADNESNCAALAEMMWGVAQGYDDFLLFKIDLGVGGALVSQRRVLTGIAGGAGEFGHITIDPNGPLCRCGNRGCLELYASFNEPLRQAAKVFGREMTMDGVMAEARAGDQACMRLVEDTAAAAGRGLAILGTVFNPGLIVVGGRMALAGEMLLAPLRQAFERHTLIKRSDVTAESATRIVAGKYTENDSCLGAVGLVLRHHGRL